MPQDFDLGVMFRCSNPPELLIPYVQATEKAGYDECWIVEDCFYAGGLTSTSVALAKSETIRVGLGIVPAVVRNAAFTAMEFAALARLYPGRFLPGIGHGVGEWMKQIGAFPSSQLGALREVTETVTDLMAGKLVNYQGKHVQLDNVKLDFPPEDVPPISLGVRGPKSLRLSGEVAGGTILAEWASPAYVTWALEQIHAGQVDAGERGQPHRITVYAYTYMDEDREAALNKLRAQLAPTMAGGYVDIYLEPMGIVGEVREMVAEGGVQHLQDNMPDEWLEQLAIVCTPTECAAAIQKLVQAGADSVVLVPQENDLETMQQLAEELLPLFS